MNKKIKKLGSDPATVERIEDRCPFCGEIFSLAICKKGTVGVSENPCCIITCNRLRRERGLPGLLEFECPGCAEAKYLNPGEGITIDPRKISSPG